MNKIVLQVGLLIFFLAVIFFAQKGLPIESVLIRSFMLFIFVTIMMSVLALLFFKSVNKLAYKKNEDLGQNLNRN